jgi:hypothetical protein
MGAPSAFRQRDVTRVIQAAKAAGWRRVQVDPRTGIISIDDAEPVLTPAPAEASFEANPWDALLGNDQA